MFTGNRDTDLLVLQLLDDKNLASICQTNSYLRNLCKDENFWRNRSIEKFSPLLFWEDFGSNPSVVSLDEEQEDVQAYFINKYYVTPEDIETINNYRKQYGLSWRDYYTTTMSYLDLYYTPGVRYSDKWIRAGGKEYKYNRVDIYRYLEAVGSIRSSLTYLEDLDLQTILKLGNDEWIDKSGFIYNFFIDEEVTERDVQQFVSKGFFSMKAVINDVLDFAFNNKMRNTARNTLELLVKELLKTYMTNLELGELIIGLIDVSNKQQRDNTRFILNLMKYYNAEASPLLSYTIYTQINKLLLYPEIFNQKLLNPLTFQQVKSIYDIIHSDIKNEKLI